ncbi:MAG: dissimilatory-type sulfite reductase subunit beta [Thermoprotei archaeon]
MAKLMIGPPHYELMLHPIIKKNYGKWAYHEHVKPGVIKHVSETGDVIYTVRAAIPKIVSVDFVRELCDIADKYCDGYIKFTSRHAAEFIITDEKRVNELINELESRGLPVGGTGKSFKPLIHTIGWNHCHTAIVDAPGLAKAISDTLFEYYKRNDLPAKLKIAIACCLNMCGAVHCSDIAIVGIHRTPPTIDDEIVSKFCEIPTVVASCPTYAIKPKILPDKRRSVEVTAERCMGCGNCYTVCPGLKIMNPKYDGLAIFVGGKVSNAKSPPMYSRLVIPYLPINPPRFSEVTEAVKKIVDTWIKYAKPDERVGEWIERIGWEKFFKLTGIPFSDKLIDDFIFSVPTFRTTTQFKY